MRGIARSALVATVAALIALACSVLPASATPVPDDLDDAGAVAIVRVEGRGHGHGIGLSQWGAHALARQGASAASIISTFYPGTTLGEGGGDISVSITSRGVATIGFPSGGVIATAPSGGTVLASVPAGGQVRVGADGSTIRIVGDTEALGTGAVAWTPAQDCGILCPPGGGSSTTTSTTTTSTVPGTGSTTSTPDSTTTTPSTTATTAPTPSGPGVAWAVPTSGGIVRSVDRGRSYRGLFRLGASGGGVGVTNVVNVEDYVRGMTEVPGDWPPAAVQAQVIAARTFALRAVAGGGSICDTDACQVYVGVGGESPGLDAAVAATRGTVVRYGGGLAATYYSASAGGFSATPAEGFGNGIEVPYLQAVEHPDDRPQPWTVEIALDEFGRRFGYPGTLERVEVTETGPSGRALAITMFGDAGERPIVPDTFRRQLGLRSTLYTIDDGTADEAPPAPQAGDQLAAVVGADGLGTVGIVQAPVTGDAILSASLGPAPATDTVPGPLTVTAGVLLTLGFGMHIRRFQRIRSGAVGSSTGRMPRPRRGAGRMTEWMLRAR